MVPRPRVIDRQLTILELLSRVVGRVVGTNDGSAIDSTRESLMLALDIYAHGILGQKQSWLLEFVEASPYVSYGETWALRPSFELTFELIRSECLNSPPSYRDAVHMAQCLLLTQNSPSLTPVR